MSDELSESDKAQVAEVFGKVMGAEMTRMIEEFKRGLENSKRIADARHETILTKLDTIISGLRK